jgi:deoxyribodipyrimidine photo-lyase
MSVAIVWFKTNLRINDNEALVKAIQQNKSIIPFYCFDTTLPSNTSFGFSKIGAFRAQFLIEAVRNLQDNLAKLGANLIIVKGLPHVEIPKIIVQYNATDIYAQQEVAFEELQEQQLVINAAKAHNCTYNTFNINSLYQQAHLPFSINNIPDIFTNFRIKTEQAATVNPLYLAPIAITTPNIPVHPLPIDVAEPIIPDKRSAIVFEGGETAAIKRLAHYFFETKALSTYKLTRNELIGPNYSSKFSPWLALGCISPTYIYHQVKHFEKTVIANESTYWLIFELLWRDYFRLMMEKYQTKFFRKNGIHNKPKPMPPFSYQKLQSWVNGTTDEPFVNANMLELKYTGFMSNRGRQNVASYLCHNLQIHWRYGAAYFEQQLIDYDVCSNWCNWAYIAGVGNDPRPNRQFNIAKQANDYDKDFSYRNLWLNT